MTGRFAPAIVAFAVGTAVVTHTSTIPEFFVQLHDANLLGAPLMTLLLATLGYPFVLSICAVLTGAAVILVAWRTRVRGAPDWYSALAAVLAVLCLTGRLGVSLDPIGWVCAAGLCLLLDRDDAASSINAVALVVLWSLLQGGATLGAVLAVIALAGALIDARGIDRRVRRKAAVAAAASIAGALQLHAFPWHAYGAHALYLDSLRAGAQRDFIWSGSLTAPAIGFSLMLIVAAWYGVRRKTQSADALSFFVLLALALIDARNLPYFGIVAGPVIADAVASFYVNARTFPVGTVRQYLVTFAAGAAAFIATLTVNEPKSMQWPNPQDPATRLAAAAASGGHRVLCENPRWCDGVNNSVMDDRAGIASAARQRVQFDVVHLTGPWRGDLRSGRVDAVIAQEGGTVEALLLSNGWRRTAFEGSRVLLQRGRAE